MEISLQNDLGPFRVNRFGDRYLINVNRERFDKLGAEVVFAQQFGKGLFEENTLYVILGSDSGLLPHYIAHKGIPDGSRYLFVELPEVLECIPREEVEKIVYTTPDRCVQTARTLSGNEYIFIDGVRLLSSCAAEDAFWEPYRDSGRLVRQSFNRYLWEVRGSLGSEVFIRRQLENLGENRISAQVLSGLFLGKTAVLLAGGPSLDDILPWLIEHRGQVAVIAVSRISRRLLEVGVIPDILVSVDPNPVNFDVSNEMFHFSKTSLLVNNYHLSPYLLGQWGGKSVFWGDMLPWDSPLNTKTSIAMGPTVTNVALDTAVEMGFSQIILAGVDLCYSRDGHTHAQSSREHALGSCFVNTDVQVETYGGWLAYTTPAYAAAIGVLDYQAQRALTRGCQIVNPAPGAARMPHVRYLKLEELVIDPVQGSPTEKIFQSLPADTKEERSRHYRQVISEIDRAVKSLSQIRDLSTAALSANKKLFGRGLEIDGKQSHRLEKIEKKLSGKYSEFSRLLKGFGIRHFIKVVHPDAERLQRQEDLERFGEVYYQAYRDSSDRLISMLAEACRRIEARQLEESEFPEVSQLVPFWREDGQPGRALVWKERRLGSANTVTLENKEIIEELTTEFESLLQKGYMNYTAHSEIQEDSYDFFLSGALSRMVAAYKKKDLSELEAAVKIFASHPSPKAKALRFLTQGYLAELSARHDDALDYYQDALDTEDKALQEEALRSIAFHCLKTDSTEDALLALRHLSETSPIYLPMYGETLKVLGRAEEALEVYAAYLEQVPEDYAAMLNLGCYYRDLGIAEGARLMFEHVLEAVPEHRVARMLLEEMD